MTKRTALTARRKRAWVISFSTVLAALATLVLLPGAPDARAVPPLSPDPTPVVTPPPVAVLAAPGEAVRSVELDGPGVDGAFMLATGAVQAGAPSELFAELRLTGVGADSTHVPVSMVVVLDHSGSMSGEKMISARESIVSLLDSMADDDRLAVVVYDDEAELLQPLAPVRVLRRSLPERIRRVEAEGGTDIPAGLALGIEALREAPEGTAQRLILVSDGRDGSGVPLSEIAARVDVAAGARVITSSLGVGLDYDSDFMTQIADAGRGNYAFLEQGEMLRTFLRRELDESVSTVAEAVVVEVTMPEGVRLLHAHGALASTNGNRVRVELGTIFAGERRKVVFEMESTVAALGSVVPLPVTLDYRSLEGARAAHHAAGSVAASVVATAAEVEAAQDDEIYPDALATVIDAQQNEALLAWRNGDRERARATSSGSLARYRRAARHAASPVVAERMRAVEAEMDSYDTLDPLSASGRSFDLGSGASRREAMAGF